MLWFRVQYGPEGSQVREDYVRAVGEDGSDTGQWLVYTYTRTAQQANWTLRGDDAVVWEYAWPPIISWQNLPMPNTYYGRDDLGKLTGLNDAVNFTLSNMMRIIKHHAHPKTIIIGANAEIQPSGVDRLWVIRDPDAKVFQLEMQSDLSSSLAFSSTLRRAFFDSGRELDPASVQDRLGDLTNFALRVLYTDTLNKTGTKRLLYEPGLKRVCRAILALGGFAPMPISVVWPDPLPQSEIEQAQALQMDAQMGLSQETYLTRRGYDAEQEAARKLEEGQGNNALLVDLFQRTSTAGGLG